MQPQPPTKSNLSFCVPLALCAALSLAACGDKAAPSATTDAAPAASTTAAPETQAAAKKILRMANAFKDKGTLTLATDASNFLKTAGAIETLVNVDMDGKAHPALATQWRRTGDNTWEFDLRPNVQFHDGSTLDAEAVANSINRILNVATPPRALKGSKMAVKAADADTVQFTTEKPDPVLPLRFGSPSTAILAKGAYAQDEMNPIGFGTGPYKVVGYDSGASVTFERFDDYWGGKPQLDGVEVRFVSDSAARYNALKAGEIQVADSISPSHILEVANDDALKAEGINLPRSSTLYVNVKKGILQNLKIRQAIDMLIDREAITATVLEGTGTPAAGYFGEAVAWAPKAAARPADYVEQAKKLIAESGVSADDLKLNLLTYTGRPELAGAGNVIKSNLEQAGFTIELDVVDYSTVFEPKVFDHKHDLVILSRGYYYDMPNALGFLTSDFGCDGSYNLNAFCDKAFDVLLQSAASIESAEERNAILKQAAQYLIDNKIGLPIYHDTSRRVVSSKVQNFELDPLGQRFVTHQTTLQP